MNFRKPILIVLCLSVVLSAFGQEVVEEFTKHEQTEYWEPIPKIVTPAKNAGEAPSDAIILFDGKNFNNWLAVKDSTDKTPAQWKLDTKEGSATVVRGTGDIKTKQVFGDFQLHIEWRSPIEPDNLKSQAKGNSGIFLQGIYEVQVLNNYNNSTYVNGQAGSIYKQVPPMANVCRVPGEWNSYDIIYTAPRWRTKNQSLEKPAYVTVIHNGVIVQNHFEIQGTTPYIGVPVYKAHGKGPIKLQDHGNAVSYRNIWIREL